MEEQLKKQVWTRFVKEGALDSDRMNKRIMESWYFCRQSGVNPYDGKGIQLLSLGDLKERQRQNARLIEAASPFLNNLHSLFKHTKSILLLIDPEGYVLKVVGEKDAINSAREINFVEGVKWTEEEVGTNAIGTALRNQEPITVIGAEHYSVASQNWVCSAAPIKDEDGNLLGVLDVSTRVGACEHDHTLGAVVASAYAIEHEWHKQMKEDELELMGRALQFRDSSPYLLCNRMNKIIHVPHSLNSLSDLRHKPLTDEAIKTAGWDVKMKTPVYSERTDRVIGYQVFVSESERAVQAPSVIPEKKPFQFPGVKGVSSAFQKTLEQAEQAAAFDIPVHLTGETGTGKGLLARAIHDHSPRHQGPFVEMNCGAVPSTLIESELFGYAPGAFTGAKKSGYKGRLLQADGGTLFLDEIGEIPLAMQVALLKVLDHQQVTAIGSHRAEQLNFRLITATNRDLMSMVKEGTMREDFFYRLYVYPVHLPSLEERNEDIVNLISWYCDKHNWSIHWPDEAEQIFRSMSWPGNIRQLINCLDRLRVTFPVQLPADLEKIKEVMDGLYIQKLTDAEAPSHNMTYREEIEKKEIKKAIEAAGGRASAAIRLLDMPRSTFYRKVKKYQL